MSDDRKCATCHFWDDTFGMCANTASPQCQKWTEAWDTCPVWKEEIRNDRQSTRHR